MCFHVFACQDDVCVSTAGLFFKNYCWIFELVEVDNNESVNIVRFWWWFRSRNVYLTDRSRKADVQSMWSCGAIYSSSYLTAVTYRVNVVIFSVCYIRGSCCVWLNFLLDPGSLFHPFQKFAFSECLLVAGILLKYWNYWTLSCFFQKKASTVLAGLLVCRTLPRDWKAREKTSHKAKRRLLSRNRPSPGKYCVVRLCTFKCPAQDIVTGEQQ